MNNEYYQKIFNQVIEKVWEKQVLKPAQNLTDRDYISYVGSRDFLIKLRKEIDNKK
jgi:hypothetical protein